MKSYLFIGTKSTEKEFQVKAESARNVVRNKVIRLTKTVTRAQIIRRRLCAHLPRKTPKKTSRKYQRKLS